MLPHAKHAAQLIASLGDASFVTCSQPQLLLAHCMHQPSSHIQVCHIAPRPMPNVNARRLLLPCLWPPCCDSRRFRPPSSSRAQRPRGAPWPWQRGQHGWQGCNAAAEPGRLHICWPARALRPFGGRGSSSTQRGGGGRAPMGGVARRVQTERAGGARRRRGWPGPLDVRPLRLRLGWAGAALLSWRCWMMMMMVVDVVGRCVGVRVAPAGLASAVAVVVVVDGGRRWRWWAARAQGGRASSPGGVTWRRRCQLLVTSWW